MMINNVIKAQQVINATDEGTFTGDWARTVHADMVKHLTDRQLQAYNGWRWTAGLPRINVVSGVIFAVTDKGMSSGYEAFGLTGAYLTNDGTPDVVTVAKLACGECGTQVTYQYDLDGGEDTLQCRHCHVTVAYVSGTASSKVGV